MYSLRVLKGRVSVVQRGGLDPRLMNQAGFTSPYKMMREGIEKLSSTRSSKWTRGFHPIFDPFSQSIVEPSSLRRPGVEKSISIRQFNVP